MRILGIDYGNKKIGLAFGDSNIKVAVPLDVIKNSGDDVFKILQKQIIDDEIELIVVGVPLATNPNQKSQQLDLTRSFIEQLKKIVSVPVEEEDESYTTSQSIHLQREGGTQAKEDALAAMLIVQAYLERID
ncbi:MAG: Holliday junction resolvase RuvX [Patescibacteria group bacterium]